MTALAGKKIIGAPFSNAKEYHKASYSFALDGGATGSFDIFEANGEILVTDFHAVVKTTCTATGSGTLDVGKTGTENYFASAVAVASLVDGFVVVPVATEGTPNVLKLPTLLADGDMLTMKLETGPFTAGVIEFTFGIMKA